jgi:DNA-binding MarR family transcriptional regulator
MVETRWLDEKEARMWRSFHTMGRALSRKMDQQLTNDSNLSSADWELLVPLSESTEQQMRVRDLGRLTGWDRSRLSHHIRRMESRGLVARFDCPTDARGTNVELTPMGRHAVEGAAPGHVETVRRYFVDLLSSEEIATITAVNERIVAALTDEDTECEREAI